MKVAPLLFAVILCLTSRTSLLGARGVAAPGSGEHRKWVASWATPISWALTKRPSMLADFNALPGGEASDQSFRMIVKPDLWGDTVRMRFSNVFGSHDISLAAASLGLQKYGGNLVEGTNLRISFGGKPGVVIPQGREVLSDPVHLSFVTKFSKPWLVGRALAVSFTISGRSGLLSVHGGGVSSYITRQGSGDRTGDEDGSAFPYVTTSFFLVKELDVLADPDTAVVCALGDSITDDDGSTLNEYDGWSDDLSIRAHKIYGDKVSVVNMAIDGNTVVTVLPGGSEPVVKRLDRDVLSISGLTSVVWLEGINDLGSGQSKPGPVIQGYEQVVARLHAHGIKVVGATVTSSLRPEPYDVGTTGTISASPDEYGNTQTNSYRKQIDEFIRTSGLFDSVADMDRATEDPSTGALYKQFQDGDYLHPNRGGHQVMAAVVDLNALASLGNSHR